MRSDSLKGYGFDFEDSVLEEEEENWGGCSFEIQRKEVDSRQELSEEEVVGVVQKMVKELLIRQVTMETSSDIHLLLP